MVEGTGVPRRLPRPLGPHSREPHVFDTFYDRQFYVIVLHLKFDDAAAFAPKSPEWIPQP
jgi:hypothetical protein